MTRTGIGLLVVALCAQCGARSLWAQSLPVLEARRAGQAPLIDGKVTEDAWRHAGRVTGFRERKSRALAMAQTEVLLLYDDENLYLAFTCKEPNPEGLAARAEDETGFWAARDDVVALFLQPDEGDETYYQYALSVSGARFEQKNSPEGVWGEKYRPAWETAVDIGGDAWRAEMRIPFSEIGVTPQMGKTWRLNVGRVRRQTGEVSTWSYSRKWHDTSLFGRLEGMIVGGVRKGAEVLDVDLGGRRAGDNRFAATVRMMSKGDEVLTPKVTVQTPAGETAVFTGEPVDVTQGSGTSCHVPYRVQATEGKHSVTLELVKSDGALCYRSPPGYVDLEGLLDCYVERSYYTDEPAACIVCLVTPAVDRDVLDTARLRCDLVGTPAAAEQPSPVSSRTVLNVPLAGVGTGRQKMRVVLSAPDGAVIADQELELTKLPPGKGSEVKVVRRDRGAYLLVNGEPFFVLSNFVCYPRLYDTDVVVEMAEAGFTAAILWGTGKGDAETRRVLEVGRRHGIKVILSPEHMYGIKQMRGDLKLLVDRPIEPVADEPEEVREVRAKLATLADRLARYKDHPALLFWRTLDEPGAVNMPQVKVCANFLRSVDPYHPLQLACGPPATGLRHKYRTTTDIYGTHHYLHGNAPMIQALDRARRTKPISDGDRKVSIGVLTGVTSGSMRGLTYAEQRCEAYLGLIGGWRGLMWFRGRHHILECWENVKDIAGQVRQLAPALMAADVEQNLRVTCDPENAAVYWVLLEHEERRTILAANAKSDRASAVFFVPGLADGADIRVRFEDRRLASTGGSFRDTFDGFGVHVYEIDE